MGLGLGLGLGLGVAHRCLSATHPTTTPCSPFISRPAAYMVKGRDIGGFGGGWLEHQRQWLDALWAGLFMGVSSCPEPPGAP